MTLVPLSEVLGSALREGYAVAGLVCQGWEDTRAYVAAAEAEGAAVILQAGPGARRHTPLPVLAKMMRVLAEGAAVPVVLHLDHGEGIEVCRAAMGEGFTSVMYDGSLLPLDENIVRTAEIAALAHAAGVSCEGEVGVVGYAGGRHSTGTAPGDAARFATETGVDALAVSVGNVHLQTGQGAPLDEEALRAIEAVTTVPLVIHGGSGVPAEQRRRLARTSAICKINIGTELRQAFGASLRDLLRDRPEAFDRIEILSGTEAAMTAAARVVIRELRHPCD
jgi:fructose-bisphosphate aldolase class II